MLDIVDQITGLSPAKRKLLAQRIAQKRGQSAQPRSIPRRPAETFPLSFAQERLWFLDQLLPGCPMYNMAGVARMIGPLDVDALVGSLNEIVRRHEILRTTFHAMNGQPIPVIAPELTLIPQIVDLRVVTAEQREAEARRIMVEEARQPFDLASGPLIRMTLLQLGDQEYLGLLTMHHIVSDGWSTKVLFEELAPLYAAFKHGQAHLADSPLPEPVIQYADYALWQRSWLQGDVLDSQLNYWREQLAGEIPLLELPSDRSRPATPSFRGARLPLAFSPALTQALTDLSRREGMTLFMVLLAAFNTLIYRYTGQKDLLVGTPIAGRNHPEVARLIGCFLNMLVLRTKLAPDSSFRDLLKQVQAVALGAYAHQDLPFEQLVDTLQPDRGMSHTPLFQVAFSFEESPTESASMSDLALQFEEIDTATSKVDLSIELTEEPHGLAGWVEYSTDLFDSGTIARMIGNFTMLLESVVTNPGQRIAELPLLTEAERRQMLIEWNRTEVAYPYNRCIHQLFEDQVARTPDAIALVFGDEQITYHDLNQRADRVAHRLRALGVGPESFVGVCIERTPALIAGVLGVLKAGGAYVPIDPAYPADRRTFILNDARASVLLTQRKLAAGFENSCTALVCIDDDADLPSDPSVAALGCGVTADNLAYVIYTSGSTGLPKGVMVAHRELVNHTFAFAENHDLDHTDRVLQFASLSFDASAATLFPPLILGATLVLPEVASTELMGEQLTRLCEDQQITVIHLPASCWHQWVDDLAAQRRALNAPLKVLLVGGEAPSVEKLHSWTQITGRSMTFLNAYGPTEAVITTTIYKTVCDETSTAGLTSVPSGRPLANKQIYLLDQHLQPVPIGVPGEVYVGGIGLARGYLNRPDLTAQTFIPHPFASTGERLYRTGDLARYLPNGQIEFVGRVDHQVKVRGFRIELGEIEALLHHHPDVLESVVIVDDRSGVNRLVAYVVAKEHQAPSTKHQAPSTNEQGGLSTTDLREYLEDRLPAYMIPAAFVVLPALPLTPHGKVDRRALPAADLSRPQLRVAFVAPRTPVEQEIAQIWTDVLGVERVGIHDSFFELGGHSLLATRIIAQVQQALQVDLPLRQFFEAPTVEGMAVAIAQHKAAQSTASVELPTIAPAPEDLHLPFPLNDIQQAYWVGRSDTLELGNVACHGYMEFDSVDLDLPRLNRAWQQLIERHGMLRAIVLPDGQQQILPEVPPYQFAVLDLRGAEPETIAAQLDAIRDEMSHQVLASDRWPLFDIRATLLDERRTRLHASVDLLIADARSFQVLLYELAQLYGNPEAVLEPLQLSFRDYVLAEVQLQETEIYQRSLDYWRRRIPELPPAPELPLAKNPAAITQPRFVRRTSRLEPTAWQRLTHYAGRVGLTPSGLLVAVFAEVLTTWSKSPRFTINLTMFNRLPLHPQVNDIFGDFTSLTLLAVDNTAQDSFEVRARQLQEQLWDDLDHRHVGGVRVQRELMRSQSGAARTAMPVVFTSTLTLDSHTNETFPTWLGESVYSIGQTPQVWLDHQVFEEAGTLVFNWDAVEELFPEQLVQDMFDTYCDLLRRLAGQEQVWQERRPCALPPAHRALYSLNEASAPTPGELLHTLFAAQVEQRPDQAAVITSERTLTYAELDRRANQIGHWLREQGARPNTLVGVVMQKGWEQVVAVLGVLASGAAYLPIDAGLPKERLWYLLEHGNVDLVLTQTWLDDLLEWPPHIRRLAVDDARLACFNSQPLEPVQQPDDLAYVIYTSGSTGLPKGVMIDHRGAVNTILDINERFGVGPADRAFAISSLSFDLSVYDVFGLLAAGGSIVIPDSSASREPAHWAALIAREQVTIWNSVPALMSMLAAYAADRPDVLLGSLRLVLLSGDWIPVALPEQIKALNQDINVISLGGATEASIWSILYPIERVQPHWKSIPYGRAMLNQQFYVLDDMLDLRPIWVPGELYIGGIGLAKGYWHDEEKTRSSFIIHPQTGERLYRTGDLGSYLPDGTIEFLGRADFQVKIQGYRIELGEIETVLGQHPTIRAAAVTAVGDLHSGKRLIGYAVLKPDATPDPDALRAFLKTKLPEYMTPSSFIFLPSLPLSANGKVDRRSLPAPEAAPREVQAPCDAPRTPIEAALVAIALEVLDLDQIGVHDSFFDLGGNSLQATQLVTRVRATFQVELPLRRLFESPTIADLASSVEATQWAYSNQQVSALALAADREEGEL